MKKRKRLYHFLFLLLGLISILFTSCIPGQQDLEGQDSGDFTDSEEKDKAKMTIDSLEEVNIINSLNFFSFPMFGSCSKPNQIVQVSIIDFRDYFTTCDSSGQWFMVIDLSGLITGQYTLFLNHGEVGNEIFFDRQSIFIVDTSPPLAPSGWQLTNVNSNQRTRINRTVVYSENLIFEEGSDVIISDDPFCFNELGKAKVTNGSFNLALGPLLEGTYELYGLIIDQAFNLNIGGCTDLGLSFTVDLTSPNIPTVSLVLPTNSSISNDISPQYRVVLDSLDDINSTIQFFRDANCSSPYATNSLSNLTTDINNIFLLDNGQDDGSIEFWAILEDQAGNKTGCFQVPVSYTLDTRPPSSVDPLSLSSPTQSPSNVSTPSFVSSNLPTSTIGDQIQIYKDNTCSSLMASAVITDGGNVGLFSATSTNSLSSPGTYSFYAIYIDQASNVGPCTPLNLSYEYDNTPPIGVTASTISPNTPIITSFDNFQPSWTDTDGKYYNYKVCLDSGNCNTDCLTTLQSQSSSSAAPLSGMSQYAGQALSVCVQAQDLAGNTTSWSESTSTLTYTPHFIKQLGQDDFNNLFPAAETGNDEYVAGVIVDPIDQSIYVAGHTNGNFGTIDSINGPPPTYNAFLAKYNVSGDLVWAKQLDDDTGINAKSGNEYVAGLVKNGNTITIAGHTTGSLFSALSGNTDIFVVNFDVSATPVVTIKKQFSLGASETASAIRYSNGSCFIVGNTNGVSQIGANYVGGGLEDALLIKWPSCDNIIPETINQITQDDFNPFTANFFQANLTDHATDLAINEGTNEIFVVGYTNGNFTNQGAATIYDAFVIRFDANLTVTHAVQFIDDALFNPSAFTMNESDLDQAWNITIDNGASNPIIISGRTRGNLFGTNQGVNTDDGWIVRLDSNLGLKSFYQNTTSSNNDSFWGGLMIDPNDKSIAVLADFTSSTGTTSSDVAVYKFDSNLGLKTGFPFTINATTYGSNAVNYETAQKAGLWIDGETITGAARTYGNLEGQLNGTNDLFLFRIDRATGNWSPPIN